MQICRPLVLILSLAACEHASTATSTSTLPEEAAPAKGTPTPTPAPPPETKLVAPAPGAKLVTPKPVADPKTVASEECRRYRMTRAGVTWNKGCEPMRVTRKPAPGPDAAAPDTAGAAKP